MYDPFAQAPMSGQVATTSIPVQQMPPQYATNNALASLYGRALPPGVPVPGVPGAPGAPGVPGGQNMQNRGFDIQAFIQAMNDWRAARPDRPVWDRSDPAAMQAARSDWRTSLGDWRSDRPELKAYRGTTSAPGV